MKFNIENRNFFYTLTWSFFLKCFNTIRAHLKRKNWRTKILMWLGRESVQNVARTRKWGGFTLHPSVKSIFVLKSKIPLYTWKFVGWLTSKVHPHSKVWGVIHVKSYLYRQNFRGKIPCLYASYVDLRLITLFLETSHNHKNLL